MNATPDESEKLSSALTVSEAHKLDPSSQLEELRSRTLSLHTELASSNQEVIVLREEIAHISRSTAWQFTQRYRKWVESGREKSQLIRLFDRSLKWMTGLAKRPELAPSSASVEIERPADREIAEDSGDQEVLLAAPEAESYESWYTRTEPGPERLKLQRALAVNLRLRPRLSVLVSVYDVPLRMLAEMVESVQGQSYPYWELCVVHEHPPDVEGREYLRFATAADSRIKLKLLEVTQSISGGLNAALELAEGEFVALSNPGDTLAPFALFQIAAAINEHPGADVLYSDMDCISDDGKRRRQPLMKPQWSPAIMLSANYLNHLSVMRTSLVHLAGGWKSDWDTFSKVTHVPGVLYHRRMVAAPSDNRSVRKVTWANATEHSVSIILVSSSVDCPGLDEWAQRLDKETDWPSAQIVVRSSNGSKVGRIRAQESTNQESLTSWLNRAVQAGVGEYLIFLDESVETGSRDWIGELVGPMQQPEVAVVGSKLINAGDGRLRHAGLVFNADGMVDYLFADEQEDVCEQFGPANWYRDLSAISGACFAVRRVSFEQAGGFRESPAYPRHDVDLCLRAGIQTVHRIVYTPFARFFQSRPAILETWLLPEGAQAGAAYIREFFALGDPYFHKQLQCRGGKVLFASEKWSVPAWNYEEESRSLVQRFDADSSIVESSKARMPCSPTHSLLRLTWILPEFVHPFYGGVHTILRFAEYFRKAHGVHSELVFPGGVPEPVMQSRLALAFPELAAESGVVNVRNYADWDRVNESDASISTLWTTAYSALHFRRTRAKFYFIQDYESGFYPAGSTYGLVEATYRFGYKGICNTRPLAEMYREFGGDSEYFDPCIDPGYFFESNSGETKTGPFRVFCYARPGHPRNCFELLTAAVLKLKQRLGDQVEIVSAGSEWSPIDFGLGGVIENLGLIGYSATGALYRTCDAGVVLMMTRHPSYLPMELMACGALVITNENRYTRWLLNHERNCLLSDTTASAVAAAIERGLLEESLRSRITREAGEQVRSHYSDWGSQSEKIYRYIVANV